MSRHTNKAGQRIRVGKMKLNARRRRFDQRG
jgi:hypothetical protein